MRRIPIITFADHATAKIYAQVVNGRLTSWNRRVFELSVQDDNARAAFEAIAMPPLDEPLGTPKDDSAPIRARILHSGNGRIALIVVPDPHGYLIRFS